MSIDTWKKEFYPTDAETTSIVGAVAHSIRKWRGIYSSNLRKHSLHKGYMFITDSGGKSFCLDSTTCSLCHHYYIRTGCKKCPIFLNTGSSCGQDSLYVKAIAAPTRKNISALIKAMSS